MSAKSYLTESPKICDTSKPMKEHLVNMAGTSMSTPAVAGAAALVRDYFINGYYPGSAPFEPSAALVKAVLINSARSLTGTVQIGEDIVDINTEYLNRYAFQGYGKVMLQNTLQFNDSTFNLFIGRQDDKSKDPELKDDQSHFYCFSVNNNRALPFKATLVWTDFPSSPAASSHLVNNLDLGVKDSKNNVRFGNTDSYSTYRDTKNNVIIRLLRNTH
jgi:subtilisin family serine protease